jgi:hypothetical protein
MLDDKRQKIRLIQQRKVSERELNELKDIPQDIPLPLSIGHRVYAHICQPEEGVFLGTVAAVDPVEHTYRVVFDRSHLGSHTVTDYEIKSLMPIQTIPVKVYVQTYRPKATPHMTPHKYMTNLFDEHNAATSNLFDPLLTNANNFINLSFNPDDALSILNSTSSGGFPVRLLVLIARLNKILNVKREFIQRLKDLNCVAECAKAQHASHTHIYTKDFQVNYATLVINIEKLNKDLSDYIKGAQSYCEQFAPDMKECIEKFSLNQTLQNNSVCKKAYGEASEIVARLSKKNLEETGNTIRSTHISQVITQLTSLMLQIKEYSIANHIPAPQSTCPNNDNNNNSKNDSDCSNQQSAYLNTQSISMAIENIKKNCLFKTNCKLFEDKVEVHLNHIQSCLNNFNKLNPFKKIDSNNEKLLFKHD